MPSKPLIDAPTEMTVEPRELYVDITTTDGLRYRMRIVGWSAMPAEFRSHGLVPVVWVPTTWRLSYLPAIPEFLPHLVSTVLITEGTSGPPLCVALPPRPATED